MTSTATKRTTAVRFILALLTALVFIGAVGQGPAEAMTVPRSARRTMSTWQTYVLHSVDGYWENVMADWGQPEPRVRYNWRNPGVSYQCAASTRNLGPFYCSKDDTMYVPTNQARHTWTTYGDFAAAFIIAHEYGHNIQAELYGPKVNRYRELQADCFAGAWAGYMFRKGKVSNRDVKEVYRWMNGIGGNDPVGHGTSRQRKNAFYKGMTKGPSKCSGF